MDGFVSFMSEEQAVNELVEQLDSSQYKIP